MYSITPEIVNTAIICTLIIIFGFYEYRRREEAHRLRMAILRRGELPPDAGRPWPAVNLLSLGSVCILYAACLGVLLFMAVKVQPKYGSPILTVVAVLSPPLLLLVLMFIRDLRRLMRHRREES